jgi:streptogramin lyase
MKPCHRLLGLLIAACCIWPARTDAQVVTEFSAGIASNAGLRGIVAGPDGNLWFCESIADKIGRITPAGVVTEFSTGLTVPAGATDIALGSDNALWFTEQSADKIGRIDPLTGAITEFSSGISAGSFVTGIAAGPDGNLWFTEAFGHRIGRITTAGVVTEFSAGLTAINQPGGIAAGPDGNLWFTDGFGSTIGRITTAGAITLFTAGLSSGAHPGGITRGPDDNMWFTESNKIGRIDPSTGTITEFSLGGIVLGPNDIAAGSDGNLWFTEGTVSHIGRITTSGVITHFTSGISAVSGLYAIAPGPDGNLWFTENAGNRIGRITTTGGAPLLQSAVSRKMHGGAGTFDLPLTLLPLTNPSTEPRQGAAATIVMTFDVAIVSATAAITEGTATAGTLTFSGNDVIVPLTGLTDRQYVTVSLSNVASAVSSGGSGAVRLGFLVGDVNQSRSVLVSDLGLINAQLAQTVSAANFLRDVNVSGTISLGDLGVANANLTRALPPP